MDRQTLFRSRIFEIRPSKGVGCLECLSSWDNVGMIKDELKADP